ncbi:MAG: hypothetical protein PUB07_00200 [Clostridia bacterium]|nr:hypothetical protein [Clostridia bacterium]
MMIEKKMENGIVTLTKLTGVHDSIMEVFDITGFLDILTIE